MADTVDSETRQQVLGPDINIPAYTYLQHHQATLGRGVYTIIAQHLSPDLYFYTEAVHVIKIKAT